MSLILPHGAGQQVKELSRDQMQILSDPALINLLSEAQLHLCCPRCLAAGRTSDALVGGRNGYADATLTVECACTKRTYRRATGH